MNQSDKDPYEKEILKTIEEMKKEGKNYLNDFQNPYDLDEKVNFQYIKRILESKEKSDQAKISAFDEIQYKLSYNDRFPILEEYEKLFAKDPLNSQEENVIKRQKCQLKKVFIALLKDLINAEPSLLKICLKLNII